MNETKKLVFGGLFVAVGIALSLVLHSIGGTQLGSRILPLHFIVILAGMLLGKWIGLTVGALMPILSTLIIGMPPLSPPIAVFMMPELATYGFVTGYLSKKGVNIYLNLLITVISGRLVYGIGYYLIGKMVHVNLQPLMALILSFGTGILGIVVQFILIPPVYFATRRYIENSNRS